MSAQSISVLALTLVASGIVAESRLVGFYGAQATVQGQKVMGAAVMQAASGDVLGVVTRGTAVVETGAAIAEGDSLITDSQGRAVPATFGQTVLGGVIVCQTGRCFKDGNLDVGENGGAVGMIKSDEHVFGHALSTAKGEGGFIEVLLCR